MHKGKDNIYVFPWKGKKIVLVSLISEPVRSNAPTLVVMQEAEFEQQLKAQREVLMLLNLLKKTSLTF